MHLDDLVIGDRTFSVEPATRDDVPAIVALLSDDVLGAGREPSDLAPYLTAFDAADADRAHPLVAARDEAGAVVATMQLTLLPGLARSATTRLQIEAVRTASSTRGLGLGAALFEWAHHWGAERGAGLAQLTTDRSRTDAHRFYDRLGYSPSHIGYKLTLPRQG